MTIYLNCHENPSTAKSANLINQELWSTWWAWWVSRWWYCMYKQLSRKKIHTDLDLGICCRLRAFLANPKGPPWTCPMVGPVGKAEVPEQFTCLEAKRQPSSTQQFPHFLPKKKGNHYNSLELTWTSTKALSSDFSRGSGHSFQPHSSTCSAHDAKQDSEETEQTPKWCWYTVNAFCNMFINI